MKVALAFRRLTTCTSLHPLQCHSCKLFLPILMPPPTNCVAHSIAWCSDVCTRMCLCLTRYFIQFIEYFGRVRLACVPLSACLPVCVCVCVRVGCVHVLCVLCCALSYSYATCAIAPNVLHTYTHIAIEWQLEAFHSNCCIINFVSFLALSLSLSLTYIS